MRDRIFKHELPTGDYQNTVDLELTPHSKPLFVGIQDGSVFLWEQHNVNDEQYDDKVLRKFLIIGTGVQMEAEEGRRLVYVGSVIQDHKYFEGRMVTPLNYVWHVYELARY